MSNLGRYERIEASTANMADDLLELNLLWEPVRPYLVKQIEELYGRRDGSVLEIGPFSGLIFDLAQHKVGQAFLVAVFPPRLADFYKKEAEKRGVAATVRIIESDSDLSGVSVKAFDLAIFRGALFFPSFFKTNFTAVYSTLKPGGTAFLGGGFGKYTPPEVIDRIKTRSRELNLSAGKIWVTEKDVREQLAAHNLEAHAEIIVEGGLWVVLRK